RSRCRTPWRAARPECSERRVDRVDERAIARVLPARPHVVRDISERKTCFGIAESECAARSKMSERARMRPERAIRLCQLKPNAETAGSLVDDVGSVDLLGSRLCNRRLAQNAYAVDGAAFGKRRIDACEPAGVAVTVGRGYFGLAPARRVDPGCAGKSR